MKKKFKHKKLVIVLVIIVAAIIVLVGVANEVKQCSRSDQDCTVGKSR